MLAYFYSYRSIKEREKLNKSLNRQKYGIFFNKGEISKAVPLLCFQEVVTHFI